MSTYKTYKHLLTWYLYEKGAIVNADLRRRGINPYIVQFLTKEDFDEIEQEWSEEKCQSAIRNMVNRSGAQNDGKICPWCRVSVCQTCEYGKRHGTCQGRSPNTYHKIIGVHPADYIYNLKGIADLLSQLSETYKKLCQDKSKLTAENFKHDHYYVVQMKDQNSYLVRIFDGSKYSLYPGKLVLYCDFLCNPSLIIDFLQVVSHIEADVTCQMWAKVTEIKQQVNIIQNKGK